MKDGRSSAGLPVAVLGWGRAALGDSEVQWALRVVWGVVSVVGLGVVLASWVLPAEWLLAAAPRCGSMVRDGGPCGLCGMTRAFIALSRGEWAQAVELNRGSPFLYAGLLLNGAVGGRAAVSWWRGRTRAGQACPAGHP